MLDDDLYVTEAPLIQAPDGLIQMWYRFDQVEYHPISNASFWIEWRLWGAHPLGYRVTNVMLHVLASLLIWATLHKLHIPAAFLAAILFAVHPVNLQSVAWIAERKNIMALVFFLLSIICFLQHEALQSALTNAGAAMGRPKANKRRISMWYLISLLAFLFAMLSKGSVATLPLVLLVITWWRRNKTTKADFIRIAPFFAVAIVLTLVHVWFQTHGRNVVIRDATPAERLVGSGTIVWFYLSKALLPIDLSFVYPQWRIEIARIVWWAPVAAAVAITVVMLLNRKLANVRSILFAWLFFCMALVPVLGFTDVGFMKYSLVSDHYAYLAMIAVVGLIAVAWSAWRSRMSRALWLTNWVAAGMVASLALLACDHSFLYASASKLYEAALLCNPNCAMLHNNLGQAQISVGQDTAALKQFQLALALDPNYAKPRVNLGTVLARLGHVEEAIAEYQKALALRPDFVEVRGNLGAAYLKAGRYQDAIDELEKCLRERPNSVSTHYNLATALALTGRPAEAIEHFKCVLRTQPDSVPARYNLAIALAKTDRLSESLEQFQQLVRFKPDYADAQGKLAALYASLHRNSEALEAGKTALRLAELQGNRSLALQMHQLIDSLNSPQTK